MDSKTLILSLPLLVSLLLFTSTVNAATSSSSSKSQEYKDYVIKACRATPFPKECLKSLSRNADNIKSDPKKLCKYAIAAALVDATAAKKNATAVAKTKGLAADEKGVMKDCVETLGYSVDEFHDCKAALSKVKGKMSAEANHDAVEELRTCASAALTDDDTCTDEIDEETVGHSKLAKFRMSIEKVKTSTRILLALITYGTSY